MQVPHQGFAKQVPYPLFAPPKPRGVLEEKAVEASKHVIALAALGLSAAAFSASAVASGAKSSTGSDRERQMAITLLLSATGLFFFAIISAGVVVLVSLDGDASMRFVWSTGVTPAIISVAMAYCVTLLSMVWLALWSLSGKYATAAIVCLCVTGGLPFIPAVIHSGRRLNRLWCS